MITRKATRPVQGTYARGGRAGGNKRRPTPGSRLAKAQADDFLANEEMDVFWSLNPDEDRAIAQLMDRIIDHKSRARYLQNNVRQEITQLFKDADNGLYGGLARVYVIGWAARTLEGNGRSALIRELNAVGGRINSHKLFLSLLKLFWPAPREKEARKTFQTRLSRYAQALQAASEEEVPPNEFIAQLRDLGGIEGLAKKVRKERIKDQGVAETEDEGDEDEQVSASSLATSRRRPTPMPKGRAPSVPHGALSNSARRSAPVGVDDDDCRQDKAAAPELKGHRTVTALINQRAWDRIENESVVVLLARVVKDGFEVIHASATDGRDMSRREFQVVVSR
jgi:hypothetical protein